MVRTLYPELPREFNNTILNFTSLFFSSNIQVEKPSCLSDSIWKTSGSSILLSDVIAVKDLPTGFGWKWNQSKTRKSVYIAQQDTRIDIMKLAARKKPKSTLKEIPSLKMWRLIVTRKYQKPIMWLHCEKGEKDKEYIPSIEEYRFLSEFMSDSIASEIWN